MSGYSDKEYLKSAISLKAITYVEKPIEIDELETAIKTAILENSKLKALKENIENNIALEMINVDNNSTIDSLISNDIKQIIHNSSFATVLIKTQIELDNSTIQALKNTCSLYHFNNFISLKNRNQAIIQLLFPNDNEYKDLSSDIFNSLFVSLGECLGTHANYYICIGEIVSKLNYVPISYKSACKMLSSAFFYDYNSIILPLKTITGEYILNENAYSEFDKFLSAEDNQKLILIIKQLTYEIKKFPDTSILYIKNIYYRLFLKIIDFAIKRKLDIHEAFNSNNAFDEIVKCSNIFILENFLINKLNDFFTILKDRNMKNNPALSVIEYIHKHYSDSNLCLEQISKNTFLTPAYICVIFKDYTSTTVNKYVNEYRIKKAKHFLMDPHISMSDIAAKVGYSDGNYFSKSFRKATSYTPSEYRRKFCR